MRPGPTEVSSPDYGTLIQEYKFEARPFDSEVEKDSGSVTRLLTGTEVKEVLLPAPKRTGEKTRT